MLCDENFVMNFHFSAKIFELIYADELENNIKILSHLKKFPPELRKYLHLIIYAKILFNESKKFFTFFTFTSSSLAK